MLGGRVEARGDLLHVEVPPGLLTPKLREAIRNQKPELLSLLRSNSGYEYTKEELETSRRRLVNKRVSALRITSSIYGDIWIALTEEAPQGLWNLDGVTVRGAILDTAHGSRKSEDFTVCGRSADLAGLWRLCIAKSFNRLAPEH